VFTHTQETLRQEVILDNQYRSIHLRKRHRSGWPPA
jgi:hypothetical protein